MRTLEDLAREAGLDKLNGQRDSGEWEPYFEGWPEQLARFRDLVLEEAAKVCEKQIYTEDAYWASDCAEAIRALKS